MTRSSCTVESNIAAKQHGGSSLSGQDEVACCGFMRSEQRVEVVSELFPRKHLCSRPAKQHRVAIDALQLQYPDSAQPTSTISGFHTTLTLSLTTLIKKKLTMLHKSGSFIPHSVSNRQHIRASKEKKYLTQVTVRYSVERPNISFLPLLI